MATETQPALDGFVPMDNGRCYDKVQTQGQQANKSGSAAEATVFCILKERGFQINKQQIVCTGIYGTEIRADLVIEPCPRLPAGLIIESKWQDSAGSVDEKFPYLVENIRKRYPYPCIVILDGGGYKPGAAQWLRAQADGQKLLAVYSVAEFMSWCIRSL